MCRSWQTVAAAGPAEYWAYTMLGFKGGETESLYKSCEAKDDATAVIHIVEGALRPSYTGTEQFRPFTLNGDTLIVRPSPGEYRELRRVR